MYWCWYCGLYLALGGLPVKKQTMDLKLKNKTAFISGSTSGIGFAIARSLMEEGVHVYINGRTNSSVDEALGKLKKDFPAGLANGIAADFSKLEEVEELISKLPPLDILINNVGIFSSMSFFETTDEDWSRHFEVNVMSGVRLSRYFLPKMIDKNWGRILFISSECATLVPEDLLAYSVTKTALLSVSRGLAQLTRGTGVTVNTIMPGSTMSDGAVQFLEGVASRENKTKEQVEAEFFKNVRTSSLLERFASVEEVANTVTYMASPLSSATNGSTIKVDGGSIGGLL